MTPKQLKASILQYAIQGKLVEQRPQEGTAEELYQQIQVERKHYRIKELVTEEIVEVPFDIPESWKWIHLQDVVKKTIKRGKSPKYAVKSNVQVFAQKCNVKTGGINMELALFLEPSSIEKYPDEEYMCNGDIVINSTGGGTMGRVGIFHDADRIDDMAIVPDGHVTVIRACNTIDYKYLYYFLKQNQKYLETQGDGSTNQTELKPVTIASLLMPLPPLGEQHRIVAKIEELLPYIDRYAEAYDKLEQFNANFPEDMKKSILQYAIQGKLVEQRPEEGTAEELYQKIQEEKQKLIKEGKIKKEKPLAEITEDEIPFDIPESWRWCYLQDIAVLNSGNQYEELSSGVPYIKVADMNLEENKEEITTSTRYVSQENKGAIPVNSIIFPKRGGAIATNKKRLVKKSKIYIDSNTMAMTLLHEGVLSYIKFWFDGVDLGKLQSGSSVPQINNKDIYPLLVPLPPLEEQHRIVAKIEELMPYCDSLAG